MDEILESIAQLSEEQIVEKLLLLDALLELGVDNWSGYGEAQELRLVLRYGSFHAVSYKNDNGIYENSFYLNTEHEEADIMFFKSDVSLAKELSVRTLGIVNVIS